MNNTKLQDPLKRFTAAQIFRYLFPVIVLGLAVHLILPQFTNLQHSYQVIRGLLWWALALATAAQVASYVGSGYLLKTLVDLSGSSLSILSGMMITLAGYSLGMVAGGVVGSSAAYYHWMQKRKVNLEGATLAGTIPGILIDLVLAAVSMVGLVHLLIVHQLTRLQGISYGVVLFVLAGLIGLLLWGLNKRDGLMSLVDRIGRRWARFRHREYQEKRTRDFLTNLFHAADLLVCGGWHRPLLGAVLSIVFDMLTIYLLFIAVGHRVSVGVLLTGYGLPLLLGRMAFMIPGGIGVIESTMTALYTSLGVANTEAVVVVLAYRLISFWLPLLLGFPMILVLQRKPPE
jgi:uncharacterized protein (TIRG00374 family)